MRMLTCSDCKESDRIVLRNGQTLKELISSERYRNTREKMKNELKEIEKYKNSLQMISRKLGGKRFQEVWGDLENARLDFLNMNEIRSNKVWIEKLVKYYYDPLYLNSLERRQVIPCFKGSRKDVLGYLQYQKQGR